MDSVSSCPLDDQIRESTEHESVSPEKHLVTYLL